MHSIPIDLRSHYVAYIATLNARPFLNASLSPFVAVSVTHNSAQMTIADYEGMIRDSITKYPGLKHVLAMLVVDQERGTVAARVRLEGGEGVEHAMYQFQEGKVAEVWSVIGKEAS